MKFRTNTNRLIKAAALAVLVAGLASGADAAGVKLTLWHNTADSPALMNLYKAYEAASGNTIEIVPMPTDGFETATITRWATGERPDILEYHAGTATLYQFNAVENFRDLSDLPVFQNGSPIFDATGSIDGKRYAVVIGYPSVFGLFYNKEILERNGITPPTSLDGLLAACQELKTKDPTVIPISEAGGSRWPTQIMTLSAMAQQNAGSAYTKAVTDRAVAVNDPDGPVVKSLEMYAQMRDAGCFNSDALTATFEDTFANVVNGKGAFVAQHSSMLPSLDAAAGGDKAKVDAALGFTGFSTPDGGAWFSASPFGTYYLPKTGDVTREEAALDFVKWVTGDGYQPYVTESSEPPVLQGYEAPPLRDIMVALDAAYKKGVPATDIVGWTNFDTLMGRLLANQLTPQEVADQMQITVEQQSQAAGLPGW